MFFETHNPEKVDNIDKFLDFCAKKPGGWPDMCEKLEDKYGAAVVLPGAGKNSAACFVRVRPMIAAEAAAGCEVLEGLAIHGQEHSGPAVALAGRTPIGGFSGVLGAHQGNQSVFEQTFQPKIATVMGGGSASLFCYGYTGAGKTHTVFGVEDDAGMYQRSAAELLAGIQQFNEVHPEIDPLKLQVEVIEVYNDAVYDLLRDRNECALRMNSTGQLLVRGAVTQKHALSAAEAEQAGGTFKLITEGLRSVEVNSVEQLEAVQCRSKMHRAVGSSSTHDQSSRSHAIFRLHVLNDQLVETLEQIEHLESIKPAVAQAQDCGGSRSRLKEIESELVEANSKVALMQALAQLRGSPLGGLLVLVDLAGSDSDSRDLSESHSPEQRQESIAINKSLLALKECLRGLRVRSKGKVQKLPFRNSSITRMLEEVLTPKPGRNSDSVMLVNVAPPAQLQHKTINSLRYGQLFDPAARGAKASAAAARARNGAAPWKQGRNSAVGDASCDSVVMPSVAGTNNEDVGSEEPLADLGTSSVDLEPTAAESDAAL